MQAQDRAHYRSLLIGFLSTFALAFILAFALAADGGQRPQPANNQPPPAISQ